MALQKLTKIKSKKSIILDIKKIFGNSKQFRFYWYTASCSKPNLSAYSFHVNKIPVTRLVSIIFSSCKNLLLILNLFKGNIRFKF